MRWLMPLAAAGLLFVVEMQIRYWVGDGAPRKGWVAPYTVRAHSDAVFDLHETHAAEAQEAKQSYVPIYDKDDELLYATKWRIMSAALSRPLESWSWQQVASDALAGSRARRTPVVGSTAPSPPPSDATATNADAGVAEADASPDAEEPVLLPAQGFEGEGRTTERRRELEALLKGCFRLLEPFYRDGVVADDEYPKQKRLVRLFVRGRYVTRGSSQLHRFSQLRAALESKAGQFFFKSDPRVRTEVIDYVLQRLPANVTYAEENERFIADISQVTGQKMVLIRRGAVLVDRGSIVGTRAHYAIRASQTASRQTTWTERSVARYGLVAALLLVFVVAGRALCPVGFGGLKAMAFVYGGILLLGAAGRVALVLWPIHPALVPHAAIAVVAAVVMGRSAAVLVAVVVSSALAFTLYFDLTGIIVGTAGGVTAAWSMRERRRSTVLAAGILVGLVQAVVFEACRAAAGYGQDSDQLWSAGQAFGGGLLSGVLALVLLPFVQRWMGQASRGKLKVIADFDHPLARRLRERSPEVFAHAVRVVDLADCAAKSLGVDRLLARAGALIHDVGKTSRPDPDPDERQRNLQQWIGERLAHVDVGMDLAEQHRLPDEVSAFVIEHHGTSLIPELEGSGAECSFSGRLPQTVESAIVMLANRVEHASRTVEGRDSAVLVESVASDLLAQHQFSECGLTQRQLDMVQRAMVTYLEGRGDFTD